MSGWILWVVAGIFENMGVVQEGMETISRANQVVDRPDSKPLAVSRGDIRFEDVSFHYGQQVGAGTARPGGIIHDFSLHIEAGEKVGLVGRSGAGKSTLVNLLLRFYDLESGRILIDGQDIARVTQDSLRAQIGMVTQDTSLLHRSVRDNILYGRPDAGEAAVVAAARKAQADDFIAGAGGPARPQGLQRARRRARRQALRRPAPARRHRPRAAEERADPDPRRGDQRARLGGRGGHPGAALQSDGRQDRDRHRPPPVDDRRHGPAGDPGQGRIVEEGSHAALLKRGGVYADLWARQSGGFLAKEAVAAE